jgi:dsRNA-specific ribonuclease
MFEDNYETLEFMGDCILKFVTSLYLFKYAELESENELTVRRSRTICNNFLANVAF